MFCVALYIKRPLISSLNISPQVSGVEKHHETEEQPAARSCVVYIKAHCLGSYLQNKGGVCDSALRRHTCPECTSAVLCLGPSPCWVLFDGYLGPFCLAAQVSVKGCKAEWKIPFSLLR